MILLDSRSTSSKEGEETKSRQMRTQNESSRDFSETRTIFVYFSEKAEKLFIIILVRNALL